MCRPFFYIFAPMIPLNQRIATLTHLGDLFRDITSNKPVRYVQEAEQLKQLLPVIEKANPWFTGHSVLHVLGTWGESFHQDKIEKWIEPYGLGRIKYEERDVLVIMAGNIPLVGMHDFVCVLLTGHRFTGKLSSRDNILFPLIRDWIIRFDRGWKDYIDLTEDKNYKAGVVIATGSNNTGMIIRQNYPGAKSIIRHNRNSIALLGGGESDEDLEKLAEDIMLYYGLGCRNVSRLFVPRGYSLENLVDKLKNYPVSLPASLLNNLKYQRALAEIHNREFMDAGKLLLIRDVGLNSPIGTVYFSEYSDINEISLFRSLNSINIQCTVGDPEKWDTVTAFGEAQSPPLCEYADGIDTINFLIKL